MAYRDVCAHHTSDPHGLATARGSGRPSSSSMPLDRITPFLGVTSERRDPRRLLSVGVGSRFLAVECRLIRGVGKRTVVGVRRRELLVGRANLPAH